MVEQIFDFLRKNAERNKELLPKLEDFPIDEQTIKLVYGQTYTITLLGIPTSSLIMQGVLMEVFVKFLYYHNKKQDFEGKLSKLIETCYKEKLFSKDKKLNEQYYYFFDRFRKNTRNNQVHFLTQKQTKGMGIPGIKFQIPKNPDGSINGEEVLKTMKEAKEKSYEECEILSTEENPAIADFLKFMIDEEIYLKQFNELNKVILELNKENNLDYSKNEK